MNYSQSLILKGFPIVVGFSLAIFGIQIIKNEENLRKRQLELQSQLKLLPKNEK